MPDDRDPGTDATVASEPAPGRVDASAPTVAGEPAPRHVDASAPTVAPRDVDSGAPTVASDTIADEPLPARTARATAEGDAPDYETLRTIDDDHYTAGREIARGGMGRILGARDRRLGRRVAIKELLGGGSWLAARFEREARITAKLQHPNIIHVYEAGRWQSGEPFYAMNLVAGRPLDKVIAEAPTFATRLGLVANVVGVVDALAYAHSEGVIHRDLKPGNVLIGPFGETVVVDWGLAKDLTAPELPSAPPSAPPPDPATSGETVAGSVLGTPAYMPPEQAAGEPVDARADVYALGAMLYHVLAGRPPFTARTAIELLAMVESESPRPLAEVAPETPVDLVAIVEKAMARDPGRRFPTAKEMSEELKRFQTGQLVTSHRYTLRELMWRWVRRHRAPIAVAALAAIVLVVVGVVSVRRIVAEESHANRERVRAQHGLALALVQKAEAAERDRAWVRAATYYQAALRQDDSANVRFAAGRAESRMIVPIARHAGHRGWIRGVAIRGDTAFSVDDTGKLERWTIADGRAVAARTLPSPLFAVAASPDGTRVAVGGDDGVVRVLDAKLDEVRTFAGHGGRIWSVAFSPDGRTIASSGEDATVRVWSDTGARVLAGHAQRVYSVAFSPDGTHLVSASDDRTVREWDLATGQDTILATATSGMRVASFSPDGTRVLFAGWDARVHLVELERGFPTSDWPAGASVHTAAMSADGAVIASGGDSAEVRLWDSRTRLLIATLDARAGQVTSLAFSSDGTRLVTAGRDGTPRVWDVTAAARLADGIGHHDRVFRLAFTRDGQRLVSSSLDGTVRLWDPGTGRELAREPVEPGCTHGAFVLGDGARFGTSCVGGPVRIWAADGHLVESFDVGPHTPFASVALDSSWIASGDASGAVRIWDLASGQLRVTRQGHHHTVLGVRTLADGTLLTCSLDNTVRRWSAALEPLGDWQAASGEGLFDAMLDPRGRFVIAGGDGLFLYRWRLPDGAALPPLPGHTDPIWAVDVSPDGRYAASASSDGTVRLWDTGTWSSVVLAGPDAVHSLAFSPDGKWLASGHEHGAVLLWNVATHQRARRLGASEVGDDGACDALDRSSWHDDEERATVARACAEPAALGFERVTTRAHVTVDDEVNVVERWP